MSRCHKASAFVAGLGVLATAAIGPASPATARSDARSEAIYDGVLRARFPPGWHVVEHIEPLTSQSNSMVFASNQAIHFNCATTEAPGEINQTTTCRKPLSHLKHNSALVQWDANGLPGWNIDADATGRRLTIDGFPARVQVTSSGVCLAAVDEFGTDSVLESEETVGSQETISAVLAARQANNFFTFNACIRGPDVTGLTRTLLASLRATQVLDVPASAYGTDAMSPHGRPKTGSGSMVAPQRPPPIPSHTEASVRKNC